MSKKENCNVYVSKYFNADEANETKRVKPEGHKFSVTFDVQDCWYGQVRITEIPAKDQLTALTKASDMLTKVLPGANIEEVSYAQTK